jgi:hypothetical protein
VHLFSSYGKDISRFTAKKNIKIPCTVIYFLYTLWHKIILRIIQKRLFYAVSTRFRAMACPYGASRLHSLDNSGRTIIHPQRPAPDNTQHTTHNRQQTDIYASAEFEPAIPVSERWRTRALDRAAAGFGEKIYYNRQFTA